MNKFIEPVESEGKNFGWKVLSNEGNLVIFFNISVIKGGARHPGPRHSNMPLKITYRVCVWNTQEWKTVLYKVSGKFCSNFLSRKTRLIPLHHEETPI